MPYPNPSYQDGLLQVVELSVYCYNNGATYTTYNGDPSEGAIVTKALNSDNQTIGSTTFGDARTGTLNLQYDLLTDDQPGANNTLRPGFIVSFRQRFYVVGAVKTPIVKNEVIKFSCEVTELQNPFIPALLSVLGQQLSVTIDSGDLPDTLMATASGTRPNATIVYSVETFATPGSAAPAGITINPSTGELTVAGSVTAGVYDVRVVVSDTVTLPDQTTDTIKGFGRYTLVVE